MILLGIALLGAKWIFAANVGGLVNNSTCVSDAVNGTFAPIQAVASSYDLSKKKYTISYSIDSKAGRIPRNIAILMSKNNAIPEGILVGGTTLTSIGDVRVYSVPVDGTNSISGITPPADGFSYVYLAGYDCDVNNDLRRGLLTWKMVAVGNKPLATHFSDRTEYFVNSSSINFPDLGGTLISIASKGSEIGTIVVKNESGVSVCFGQGCAVKKDIAVASNVSEIPAAISLQDASAIRVLGEKNKTLSNVYLWISGASWIGSKKIHLKIDGEEEYIQSPSSEVYSKLSGSIANCVSTIDWFTRNNAISLLMALMGEGVISDGGEFCQKSIREFGKNSNGRNFADMINAVLYGNQKQLQYFGIKTAIAENSDATAFSDGYTRVDLVCKKCLDFWQKKGSTQLRWSKNIDLFTRNGTGIFVPIVRDGKLDLGDFNATIITPDQIELARANGIWVKSVFYVDNSIGYAEQLLGSEGSLASGMFAIAMTDSANYAASTSEETFVGYFNGGNILQKPRIGLFRSGRSVFGFDNDPQHTLLVGNPSMYGLYKDPYLQNWSFSDMQLNGQEGLKYGKVDLLADTKISQFFDFRFSGDLQDDRDTPFRSALVCKDDRDDRYVVPYKFTARDRMKYVFYSDDHSIGKQMRKISTKHGSVLNSRGAYVEKFDLTALPINFSRQTSENDVASKVLSWSNGYPNFVNLYTVGDKLADGSNATAKLDLDYIGLVSYKNTVTKQGEASKQITGLGEMKPSATSTAASPDWVVQKRAVSGSSSDIDAIARNVIANRSSTSKSGANLEWSEAAMESVEDILAGVQNATDNKALTNGAWGEAGVYEPEITAKIAYVQDLVPKHSCNNSNKWRIDALYKSATPTQLVLSGDDGKYKVSVKLTEKCDKCDVKMGGKKCGRVSELEYICSDDWENMYDLDFQNQTISLLARGTDEVTDIFKTDAGRTLHFVAVGSHGYIDDMNPKNGWIKENDFLKLLFNWQSKGEYFLSSMWSDSYRSSFLSVSAEFYRYFVYRYPFSTVMGVPTQTLSKINLETNNTVTHVLGYSVGSSCSDAYVTTLEWDANSRPSKLLGDNQYGWNSYFFSKLRESGILDLAKQKIIEAGLDKSQDIPIPKGTFSGYPNLAAMDIISGDIFSKKIALSSTVDAFGAVGQCSMEQFVAGTLNVRFDAVSNMYEFVVSVSLVVNDLWDFEYSSPWPILTKPAAVVQAGLGTFSSGAPMLNKYRVNFSQGFAARLP